VRQEILEYMLAVGDHWFFWFGGIVLVIFELVKRIPNWKDKAEKWFPAKIFWGVAVLCMAIATFQAWHEEHTRAAQLSDDKIALSAKNDALNAENGRLTNQLIAKERPIVIQAVPDAEVQKLLKRQDEELAKLKNSVPSSRKKALQLSNDILNFLSDRMKTQPDTPELIGMTKEQWQQKMNEHGQNYDRWMRETAAEYQVRFGARVSSVSDDMQSAGLNTVNIQGCIFSNGNTFRIQQCGAQIGALAEKLPR
jgi:hypothetical protein